MIFNPKAITYLSAILLVGQVSSTPAATRRLGESLCSYKVELKSGSSEASPLKITLQMEDGDEHPNSMVIGTDFGSHYLDFNDVKCGNVKGLGIVQESDTLTEIVAIKVHKDGSYVYGDYCFSKAKCGQLRLTNLDACGSASAGGVKLGKGDMLQSFRDGSEECSGGPCDEQERAKITSENKCFDFLPTSNLAPDNVTSSDDECQSAPIACVSDDPNETASCDPATGCVFTCETTDLCTKKFYNDEGKCMSEPVVCDDSDPRTLDTCDPEKGCVHSCVSPDDLCKVPHLDDDMKCQFKERVCDDGNPETMDSCDPDIGCVHKCGDDNNACTIESFDDNGKCVSTPIVCDDQDPFTLDVCDPASGCMFLPLNEDLEDELDNLALDKEIFVYEDKPTLSEEDERAILLWLKTEMNQKNTPFCWKRSYGRGVGKVLTECPEGKERVGALCYSKCPAGYSRQGTLDCQQNCSEGWRDDGLFCRLAEYGRGAGFAWTFSDGFSDQGMYRRCERKHGKGKCEKWGAVVYPKCKEGYEPRGCCICGPKSFDCKKEGYAGEFGGSCAAKIKLGDPTPMKCKPGMDEDAGLCYKQCKKKFNAVGPVCWQKCDKDQVDCGFGCANSAGTCVNEITDMVLAPLIATANVAINLAKMGLLPSGTGEVISQGVQFGMQLGSKFYSLLDGTDSGVGMALLQVADKIQNVDSDAIGSIGQGLDTSAAWTTFVGALQTGADEVLSRIVKPHSNATMDMYASIRRYEAEFAGSFGELTSPEIEAEIDSKLSEVDAYRIKQLWADVQFEEIAEREKWNTTLNDVLYWTDIIDNHVSGILGFEVKEIVSAYAKPICHEIHPFPELEGRAEEKN
ncbi:expressed unknown protein [Seminavis robusta]|uniref:Uncharacterized protein n=1 Tax=Seminavis robusta TaxID=568900 RepID=A0A9N8E819_9STRA|nr:expressed unknown protein [Seminavis robusta]|eukprot:Sro784_g201990.1 n/a (854) ;mRNA; f:15590-18508